MFVFPLLALQIVFGVSLMLADFPLRTDAESIFEGNCLYLQRADRTRWGLSVGIDKFIFQNKIPCSGQTGNAPQQRAQQQDTITYLTPPCWSVALNQEKLPRRQAFQIEERSRSSVFSGKC